MRVVLALGGNAMTASDGSATPAAQIAAVEVAMTAAARLVAAGAVVVLGELIGVAKRPIAANNVGTLAVAGVFDFPKAAGSAITAGVKVYWDAGNSVATTDADDGTNKYLGKTVRAAADADATVRVRLEQ